MPIRIPDEQRPGEAEERLGGRDDSRAQQRAGAPTQDPDHTIDVPNNERRLPVGQIIGACIAWRRPPVTRRQILEELNSRPGGGPQRRDAQPCAEHIVQPFLLWPIVLAATHHSKAERVSIARQAPLGVRHHDRGVINAEKQPVGRPVPTRIALVRGEPEDLEEVAIGISEVERADPAGVRVPVRQPLGRW